MFYAMYPLNVSDCLATNHKELSNEWRLFMNTKASEQVVKIEEQNLTRTVDSFIFRRKNKKSEEASDGSAEDRLGRSSLVDRKQRNLINTRATGGACESLCGELPPKHIHYDEQVIYVVQGQAISVLDGEESHLRVGEFYHWKAGVEHRIYNTGNVPFQHLLVSNPVIEEVNQEFPEREEADKKPIAPDLIYIAAEAIRTQFLETLHYGYAIFDSLGNLILQSQYFPEFCVECCQPSNNAGICSCMRQVSPKEWEQEHVYYCKNGMEKSITIRSVFGVFS